MLRERLLSVSVRRPGSFHECRYSIVRAWYFFLQTTRTTRRWQEHNHRDRQVYISGVEK